MSRDKEQRNSIFEIESCERFNVKTIRNVKRFYRRIYATYSA